jgi:hypothetical protein
VPECLGVPVLVLNVVSPSAPLPAVPGSVTKSRPLLLLHHKTFVSVQKGGGEGEGLQCFMRLKFPSSVTVLGSGWQSQLAQLFVLQIFAEICLD